MMTPGLTLTYFMEKSILVPQAFEWKKNENKMHFAVAVVLFDKIMNSVSIPMKF